MYFNLNIEAFKYVKNKKQENTVHTDFQNVLLPMFIGYNPFFIDFNFLFVFVNISNKY